jgi:hypothetical protein
MKPEAFRKNFLTLMICIFIQLPSFSNAQDAEVLIFGDDSRRDPVCESDKMAYQARAIAEFRGGTAFLISPENHVLTAAHVFNFDVESLDRFDLMGTLTFDLQDQRCNEGQTVSGPNWVNVYKQDLIVINRDLDYALFQLPYKRNEVNQSAADADLSVGVHGLRWLNLDPTTQLTQLDDAQKGLYVLAYNSEFGKVMLSSDDDCRIFNEKDDCDHLKQTQDDGGPWGGPVDPPDDACLDHHCDGMQSNSGGPLFLRFNDKVIGIESGHQTGAVGVGYEVRAVKIRRIFPEINAFLPSEYDMEDNDGDGMPNCRDNCPDTPNTGTCVQGVAFKLHVPNSCISNRDCDSYFAAFDGQCDRSQLQMDTVGDGMGDACSRPENPELLSSTHGKGQPSCDPVVSIHWDTPNAVRGIGGYSVVFVNQDDPYYDENRIPDDTPELSASATSFTTPALTPGHIWEINIKTIDSGGLPARFYASFWVQIETCGFDVTYPRADSVFQTNGWEQIVWGQVKWDGNDVSAGYNVGSIDLYKENEIAENLWSNYPNLGSISWLVPSVETGTDYKIGIILDRNTSGDMFPELPERLIGFSEQFTIMESAISIPGDADGDGDVDRDDINLIVAARNQPASGPDDPRDLDGDGIITVLDARKAVLECTLPGCAVPEP